MTGDRCAYCGGEIPEGNGVGEHVIARGLYGPAKAKSSVQRLKVPACSTCAHAWDDDEAHFRFVAVLAGNEPNEARRALWRGKITSSLHKVDGRRRAHDVARLMRPVELDGATRYLIYPGDDPRCLRVVRKIVRGLSYHHKVRWPVADGEVWADVLRYRIPPELLEEVPLHHRDLDIFRYRYTTNFGGDALLESAGGAHVLRAADLHCRRGSSWTRADRGPKGQLNQRQGCCARHHIRRSAYRGQFYAPKTRRSRRTIDLGGQLLLTRWRWEMYHGTSGPAPEALMFPSPTGVPLDPDALRKRVWAPALAKAGLRHVRIHSLRHTFASMLIAQGENVKYISTQLGHASVQITLDRYGHLFPDEKRTTAARFEAQLMTARPRTAEIETR